MEEIEQKKTGLCETREPRESTPSPPSRASRVLHNPVFFCSISPNLSCVPKLNTNLYIYLLGRVKVKKCSKKGKVVFFQLHNTRSCTTQRVAQHRELHNTGRCTTQGDAHRHSSLDIFRGVRGALSPPLVTRKLPTQQRAQHREVHNTASCTTQGVAQWHSRLDIFRGGGAPPSPACLNFLRSNMHNVHICTSFVNKN